LLKIGGEGEEGGRDRRDRRGILRCLFRVGLEDLLIAILSGVLNKLYNIRRLEVAR
jgi:hypothetical protein